MFIFKRNQIIITALVFMVAIAAYLNFTDTNNLAQPTFEDSGKTTAKTTKNTDTSKTTKTSKTTDKEYFPVDEFAEIDTLAPDMDSMGEENMAMLEDNGEMDLEADFADENVSLTLKDKVLEENKMAQAKTDKKVEDSEMVQVNKNYDVSYFVEAKMDREQRRSEQIEILTQCVNNKTLDQDSKANAASNLITLQERIEKESSIESLLKAKGFKEVFVRMSDDNVDVVINREKLEEAEIAQIEDIVRRKTGYATSQITISPLKN